MNTKLTTHEKLQLAQALLDAALNDHNLPDDVYSKLEDSASFLEDAEAMLSVSIDRMNEVIGENLRQAEINSFTLTGAQLGVR